MLSLVGGRLEFWVRLRSSASMVVFALANDFIEGFAG